jgi:hypothetical protein
LGFAGRAGKSFDKPIGPGLVVLGGGREVLLGDLVRFASRSHSAERVAICRARVILIVLKQ